PGGELGGGRRARGGGGGRPPLPARGRGGPDALPRRPGSREGGPVLPDVLRRRARREQRGRPGPMGAGRGGGDGPELRTRPGAGGPRVSLVEHVLVVGAGQMGGGIAQVVAASGRRVSLYDPYPGATDRALETMGRSLAKLAEKGGPEPSGVLERVSAVDELVP